MSSGSKESSGFELSVSPDKMKVFLRIIPEEDRDLEGEGEHGPEKLYELISLDDVREALNKKGIVFGCDLKTLSDPAALELEEGKIVVARGKKPSPGRDAEFRYPFLERFSKITEKADDRVDFREKRNVISVDPGEILIEKIPAVAGENGINIFGEVVRPASPQDPPLKAGFGTELNEKGSKIIAKISGRPEVSRNFAVVYPVYTVPGDLDAGIGNINFKGDVVIRGNVAENMKIKATGKVTIYGTVDHAEIWAGKDVIIYQNLLGGKVQAGGQWIIIKKLEKELETIFQQIDKLYFAVKQLEERASEKKRSYTIGNLLKLLLEKQYPHFSKQVLDLIPRIVELEEQLDVDEFQKLRSFLQEMTESFSGLGPLNLTIDKMVSFRNSLTEELIRIRSLKEKLVSDKGDITVGYVQSSQLNASGNVNITKKGSYYTNIYASGDVVVDGFPGIFRNGEIITSQGNVKVRELGSPSEADTVIEVSPHRSVVADKVYPGVIIKTGGKIERINKLLKNVSYS